MSWIGFGVALIAVAITFWTWGRFRGAMSQLESNHEQKLKAIESEHTKRIDRVSREAEKTKHDSATALVKDLAPAMDAITEALKLTPDDDGLTAIQDALMQGFSRHNVDTISPDVGEPFSPTLHEAIESRPSEIPRGKIAEVFRVGWRRNDVCVRPALVAVSAGAETKEEE